MMIIIIIALLVAHVKDRLEYNTEPQSYQAQEAYGKEGCKVHKTKISQTKA